MNKQDVQTKLLQHSKAKIRLLGEYLKRYLNIIVNDTYTERIKIFDVFCGEGIYKNQGEGSPLVILRLVKDIYLANKVNQKRIPPIDCYFNDIDTSKIEKLKNIVAERQLHSTDFGEIEFSSQDYKEKIKDIYNVIDKLKNQKAFVFIDPYGYKNIKANDIKTLLFKKMLRFYYFFLLNICIALIIREDPKR